MLVVTGLPRSGTSWMMQILDAMGCKVWMEGCKRTDSHNPWGYWEDDRCNRKNFAWMARANGAVKCLWPHVFELALNGHLFILMERDSEAVRASLREHFPGWMEKVDLPAEQARLRAHVPQAVRVRMEDLSDSTRLAAIVNTIEDSWRVYLGDRRTKLTPVLETVHGL